MRIGELAELAGTSARTLRYYEQQGLLTAKRTANGYREYDEGDLRVVRQIRSLLEIGFTLDETRPFVDCLRTGHRSGAECPASIAVLGRKLTDLDSCIVRLLAVRGQVSQELTRAGAVAPSTGRASVAKSMGARQNQAMEVGKDDAERD
jgi:DNA-binding transcriptional MerR regulator